jgi:hypothetical protein
LERVTLTSAVFLKRAEWFYVLIWSVEVTWRPRIAWAIRSMVPAVFARESIDNLIAASCSVGNRHQRWRNRKAPTRFLVESEWKVGIYLQPVNVRVRWAKIKQ